MRIVVTGGAGYIGSHMVRLLVALGHTVTVIDTLEYGHKESLPSAAELVVGSVDDPATLEKVFSQKSDAVIHFAAYISVEESVHNPRKYMLNNLIAPCMLLEAMKKNSVPHIIFSSTAAVYGNPQSALIPEDHPKNPLNSYGLSKWCFEELLKVYEKSHGITSISLRYFNASGASMDGMYGEHHKPETHIIPRALTAAREGSSFTLFGTNYETRDGSCERDYIHVEDLCRAHLLALDALAHGHKSDVYNVGTGKGVTNSELLAAVERVTGKKVSVEKKERRSGDAGVLVADTKRIGEELGFVPKHSSIDTIIETAWKWHTTHPDGYAA